MRLALHKLTATVAVVAAIIAVTAAVPETADAADVWRGVPATFEPVTPTRLVDTRETGGRLAAGGTLTVQVTGRAGVPKTATAAVVNVTAVNAAGHGHITVWPAGQSRTNTSISNQQHVGDTVAATTIATLGTNGAISIYSYAAADIIVDITGYMRPAASDTARGGRFVGVAQHRIVDTRPAATFRAGETRTIDLRPAGVPASARAVVVNLTGIASEPGHVTAWSGEQRRPTTSMLNMVTPNTPIANMAVIPVHQGRISLYSFRATDIIVDVTGYFTGDDAPTSSEGLYRALVPHRVLDSRDTPGSRLRMDKPRAHSVTPVSVLASGAAPDAAAVAFTLTVTQADGPSYATVWPADAARPTTSMLNPHGPGATVANSAIVGPVVGGGLQVYQYDGGHAIVDVTGYFTSSNDAGEEPDEPIDPDSSLARKPTATKIEMTRCRRPLPSTVRITYAVELDRRGTDWHHGQLSGSATVTGAGADTQDGFWVGTVTITSPVDEDGFIRPGRFEIGFSHLTEPATMVMAVFPDDVIHVSTCS